MTRWDEGYVTDVPLVNKFYREMTPAWLAFVALLAGYRPPDIGAPFRYADLGCGMGLTAVAVAALYPHAEVWGFDFNPAHIEGARLLAARAGLTNIQFIETSFDELARRPAAALPEFAFMISQGTLHSISEKNRNLMIEIIGQRLQAGGLACHCYNIVTGMPAWVPLLRLTRTAMAAKQPSIAATAPGILSFLDRLKQAGARYFAENPSLDQSLEWLRQAHPSEVAHVYASADWQPIRSAEVMAAMAEAKCALIGSAALVENFEALSVPETFRPVLAEFHDPQLRETLKEFAVAQSLRHDVYRRGLLPLSPSQQLAMLGELRFMRTGPAPSGDVTFATPTGELTGRAAMYQPLLALLEQGPVSLPQVRGIEAFATQPPGEALLALTLLVSGGFAHPLVPGDPAAARRSARALNQAIVQMGADGHDLSCLVAPAIGSALRADTIETLVVGKSLEGVTDPDALTGYVHDTLRRTGRTLHRDGRLIEDAVESHQLIEEVSRSMLGPRAALLRALGILDP